MNMMEHMKLGDGGVYGARTAVPPYDRWLLTASLLLVGFGALMIYSSTAVVAPSPANKNLSQFYYFKKHIFTMLLGFGAMCAASRLRPEYLKMLSAPFLALSLVLLLLVFVPGLGVSAGGARRWLRLWPSTFQPSELVKLAMVIFTARFISSEGYKSDRFSHFIAPVAVMAVFQAVFLMQPDFGAAMSLCVITLGMLFLSGARLRHIGYLCLPAIPVVVKLLYEPYRLRRITSFLDPWSDPRGSGFQLVQSFIALGSGGLTGAGLGKGMQKLNFLPEVHTDFIFSIVGEELGFAAAVAVVFTFGFIFLRGIVIANRAADKFSGHLAFGLSMMLGVQALVNFAVVTGMLPTKGLPLPFISYGGSALLVNMAAVGILLGISRPVERKIIEDPINVLMKRKKAKRSVYGRAF